MASLSVFQPYVDKENESTAGVRHKTSGGSLAGKIFQSTNSQYNATPRKALGVVNRDVSKSQPPPSKPVGLKPSSSGLKPLQPDVFKQPAPLQTKGLSLNQRQPLGSKKESGQNKQQKKQKSKGPVVTTQVKSQQLRMPTVDDIEHMHVYMDPEDDYEDIWPKKDRPSSYMDKIRSWRPPCLFGDRAASDDEQSGDEDLHLRLHEVIKLPTPEEMMLECQAAGDEEPQDLLDDFLKEADLEIPIPFLDETLDILPDLGTLELKD